MNPTQEVVMWGAWVFMTVYGIKTIRKVSFLAISGTFLPPAWALWLLKWKMIKNHLNPTQEDVVWGAWTFMTVYGLKTIRKVSFLAISGPFLPLAGALHQLKWKAIKNHLNPTHQSMPEMLKICSRYAQDMPKNCPRYAKDTLQIWQKYVQQSSNTW